MAVDTLRHLLALHITPANIGDREEVGHFAEAIQDVTGESVTLAYVDQGYTGEKVAEAASTQGIALHVVKLPEAKRGFVLLPRRWVIERSVAWQKTAKSMLQRWRATLALLAAPPPSAGEPTSWAKLSTRGRASDAIRSA